MADRAVSVDNLRMFDYPGADGRGGESASPADDDGRRLVSPDGSEPVIANLLGELQSISGDDLEDFRSRMERANDVRFAQWDGQSADGRKREAAIGAPAFPWEGASDQRVRICERIIQERVLYQKAGFSRGRFQATPVESGDMRLAANVSRALRYQFKGRNLRETRDVVDFLLNWKETYGCSILHVDWLEETGAQDRVITLEELERDAEFVGAATARGLGLDPATDARGAAIAAQSAEDFVEAMTDPGNAAALAERHEDLDEVSAARVLEGLRVDGEASFRERYTRVNRPRWTALCPGVDVFFPLETCDLQGARFIAVAEFLCESELREKGLTEGWDGEFIDEVLKHRGVVFSDLDGQFALDVGRVGGGADAGFRGVSSVEDYEELFQVLRVYYRVADGEGYVTTFMTVLHPMVNDFWGRHGAQPELDGQYPFVDFRRERVLPQILESRGVPQVMETDQDAVKVQRDARTDRASVTTLPPVKKPANMAGTQLRFGPGKEIVERKVGTISWMDPPRGDDSSIESEAAVLRELDLYWGRSSENVDPELSLLHRQNVVDDFLIDLSEGARMTFGRMQQRWSADEWASVLGAGAGAAGGGAGSIPGSSRDAIQGQFDVLISFDIRELNLEYVSNLAKSVGEFVAPLDREGSLMYSKLVRRLFEAIDPGLADEVTRDGEESAFAEAEDEKSALAQMASGVEPLMRESGENAELRLQVLEDGIQKSPPLQQRYEQDEFFRALVDARVQHFRHVLEQRENAQIGRLGVRPVTG